VRTLTGNYQLCQLIPRLLVPNSALVFQFYSHKLMRLAAPIFFLLLLAANVMLAAKPPANAVLIYQAALAAQSLFYGGVLAGAFLLKRNRRVRMLTFAYVFSLMNAAALVGLFYFVMANETCGREESET
jgi:peptidoglycan/LPS O-acetylase OafA/YrhL